MHKIKLNKEKTKLFKAALPKIFLISFILLFAACKSYVTVPEQATDNLVKRKLLVLPFKNMAQIYGEKISVKCPLCGNFFMTGEVGVEAEDILTQSLIALMKSREQIESIPLGQVQGVLSEMLSKDEGRVPERDQIVETGRILGAGAVLAGYVYRFRERIGNRFSVDLPASAAFDVHLVDVSTRRILWTGRFDETQGSLSENLLKIGTFLKRRGVWVTVDRMAVSGLEDMLKTFPEINTR